MSQNQNKNVIILPLFLGGIMRKVILRMNEENKYKIIKKLVETNKGPQLALDFQSDKLIA